MKEIEYGSIQMKLAEVIANSGLSKNKVSNITEMQRTQLNRYCNGKVQRVDLFILAKLCYALDCKVEDILEYLPLKNETPAE